MTHSISPHLTQRQKSIIIGTILGGSSIIKPKNGKNCYLSMRDKKYEWLLFKAMELSNLASNKPLTIEKTNRWHSICYPLFNEFKEMFYKNNKRNLNIDVLSKLHDVAIAIWYGDAGICEKEQISLNTTIWEETGTKTILEYFQLLGYEAKIIKERKNNLRVLLDQNSSAKFIKLINPTLPMSFFRN